MLSCKSPLHAHPNFYLLTLFHPLSLSYPPLIPSLVVLVRVSVLVLVLVRIRVLLPLYCPFTVFFLVLYFAFSLLRAIIWIHGSGASTSKPKFQITCFCGVEQSGSSTDSYSVGRGFKSHPRYHLSSLGLSIITVDCKSID